MKDVNGRAYPEAERQGELSCGVRVQPEGRRDAALRHAAEADAACLQGAIIKEAGTGRVNKGAAKKTGGGDGFSPFPLHRHNGKKI